MEKKNENYFLFFNGAQIAIAIIYIVFIVNTQMATADHAHKKCIVSIVDGEYCCRIIVYRENGRQQNL